MSTYRVMHRDENNEGRFEDVEAADYAQAIWSAAQHASGGSLVAVNQVNPDGTLALPVPSATDG